MTTKKRTWKFWVSRTLLIIFVIGGFWLTNLIWFRPFNIRHFYNRVFVEAVFRNPELITQLGVPVLYDFSKDKLNDISIQKDREELDFVKKNYETLVSYDFESQSKADQLNTNVLKWFMKADLDGEPFLYHGYPVNQMSGIQNGLPSFMASAHKLRNKSDMEAYIARLSLFGVKFDQLIEKLRFKEEKGIVPPRFVIERVLTEMKGFISKKEVDSLSAARSNILYTNFVTKVEKIEDLSKEEKDSFAKKVETEIQTTVFPAYQKLIDYFESLKSKATTDDGVWKLPDGDAFYRYRLRQQTTTDMTPEQVHQIGLSEVARIKKEMWSILISQGYKDTTKTIGAIVQALSKEDRFLYPDNDEGREELLKGYKEILDKVSAGLDGAFDIRPKSKLDVQREPTFREGGQAKGHYNGPSMDGSRGGVFFANLRSVLEHPKFGMKTLAYHEGIPGHHFQIAIQSELKGLPLFRTVIPFTAYSEGWGLYSERLAWELGFYENDPFGNLGRLQAEMMRAVRLVVDTGIHFKKWTREEAIKYMVANTGLAESDVTTEIERYIVTPGQACAYKIGMMKILELREKAKSELGDKFDLRQFHNVVLQNGAVPLEILEELVNEFIANTKTR